MQLSDDSPVHRIAYVTPYDEQYSSIFAHTSRRIEEWVAGGVPVRTFTIGGGGRARRGAAENLLVDLRKLRDLVEEVSSFEPTVVYVRWFAPVPGLYRRLASVAPIVAEIHANDLVEVAGTSWLRRSYLRAFRASELRHVSGATFVTSELANDPEFRLIPGPRAVFGNGSWLSRRAESSSGRPRLGISTAALNDWTGLDRFAALAEELADIADCVVACPEHARSAIFAELGDAVEIVGTRDQREYAAEVSSWSAAIGTLALERKGLRVASPLKVRDYLGLGVPTVLPYWDEGVAAIDDELLLKLAGPTDPPVERIDPSLLRAFIAKAHGRDLPTEVSAAATGVEIERRRLDFLESFSARQ